MGGGLIKELVSLRKRLILTLLIFSFIAMFSATGCSNKKMAEKYSYLFSLGEGIEYRSYLFQVSKPTTTPYPIQVNDRNEYSRNTHGSHAETIGDISFEVAKPFTEGIGCVKLDGKWGYVTLNPEDNDKLLFLVEPIYEGGEPFNEGMAAIVQNGKYGYINKFGEIVITPKYEKAQYFYDGLAPVLDEKGWFFINTEGKAAFDGFYEDAGPFYSVEDSFLAPVKKEGKWGYINNNGKVVIDFLFDDAWSFEYDGKAPVRIKNKWFYISKSGKKI